MALVRTSRRGSALLIGLHRPDKHNALDEVMVAEIDRALTEASREPCVVIVHSTTPGIFAAGADIAELIERDADAALRALTAIAPNTSLFDGNNQRLAGFFRIGRVAGLQAANHCIQHLGGALLFRRGQVLALVNQSRHVAAAHGQDGRQLVLVLRVELANVRLKLLEQPGFGILRREPCHGFGKAFAGIVADRMLRRALVPFRLHSGEFSRRQRKLEQTCDVSLAREPDRCLHRLHRIRTRRRDRPRIAVAGGSPGNHDEREKSAGNFQHETIRDRLAGRRAL